jgi:RNA polymerase sigma-70 factor, ECF subfamily
VTAAGGCTAPEALVALYDEALPEVYGYLLRRCGDIALAEDLTAEAFLAAASAVKNGPRTDVTVAWLVAVARNKLVDHWRREARERRTLRHVHDDSTARVGGRADAADRAARTLRMLSPDYRAALVLRHVDGLSVAEVSEQLGRTLHATEALLSRARRAFRSHYEEAGDVTS